MKENIVTAEKYKMTTFLTLFPGHCTKSTVIEWNDVGTTGKNDTRTTVNETRFIAYAFTREYKGKMSAKFMSMKPDYVSCNFTLLNCLAKEQNK